MRLLAVVPARGGSKRLPGKNVRLLDGVPLIAWSIQAARGIREIADIVVSTDDPAAASLGRASGALVPWLRPEALATDDASSVDVCIHALDWYEDAHGTVDGLLLLQPTSPLRTAATIRRGIELFEQGDRRTVIAFAPAQSHPFWCYRIEDGAIRPFIRQEAAFGSRPLRSQDLPPAYVISGALYLISPSVLREQRRFMTDDVVPLVVDDRAESIDIDTEWDWQLAEFALAARRA